jgi:hypothetical protein
MDKSEILNNLEGKLTNHWIAQKDVKKNKENINQYFKAFSDLRYFVDRDTGNLLYEHNEQGQITGKLDYQSIYTQSPELTIVKNGEIDQEASEKYVNEMFKKTNESMYKLKLIDEIKNDSRLHNKFGEKGHLIFELPPTDPMFLYKLQNVAPLYSIFKNYIDNALNLVKKLDKKQYTAITEDQDNNNAMNSFLTVCNNEVRKLEDTKFNMNNYLNEKLTNIVSSLDNMDKVECENPLIINRSTDYFNRYLIPLITKEEEGNQGIDKELFDKYTTKDMKVNLEKLIKH